MKRHTGKVAGTPIAAILLLALATAVHGVPQRTLIIRFSRVLSSENEDTTNKVVYVWLSADPSASRLSFGEIEVDVAWILSRDRTFSNESIVTSGHSIAQAVTTVPGLRARVSTVFTGLSPGTRYFFRFKALPDGPHSHIGTFVTARGSGPKQHAGLPGVGASAGGHGTARGGVKQRLGHPSFGARAAVETAVGSNGGKVVGGRLSVGVPQTGRY